MITIKRGLPYVSTITLTDQAGDPFDLTGKTVFFTVKRSGDLQKEDTFAVIKKDIITHDSPLLGITTLSLLEDETNISAGTYKADFKIYGGGVNDNTNSVPVNVVDVITKRVE